MAASSAVECNTDVFGMQCNTLRSIEKGGKSANYTKKNGQFHWGVSPADQWVLFDTSKDPGCRNDLSNSEPERVKAMAAAFDTWWDDMYPTMVERGGEVQLKSVLEARKKKQVLP